MEEYDPVAMIFVVLVVAGAALAWAWFRLVQPKHTAKALKSVDRKWNLNDEHLRTVVEWVKSSSREERGLALLAVAVSWFVLGLVLASTVLDRFW